MKSKIIIPVGIIIILIAVFFYNEYNDKGIESEVSNSGTPSQDSGDVDMAISALLLQSEAEAKVVNSDESVSGSEDINSITTIYNDSQL
jgi:hypothetical protein